MKKNLSALAPSSAASEKSASKSSSDSPRPWESPEWEETVRQTPALKPFFDNLESFVELPEGVAKLRTLFLDLVVRGKLVDQHENEHDIDYAERVIRDVGELSKTVGTRRAAKQKAPEIDPFPLPPTWTFVSVGTIGVTQTGTTPTKKEPDNFGDFIPFIKPGDIQSSRVDYENDGLSEKGLASGRLVPACSVLMVSIGGSIGKAAVVERNVSCNQQINTLTLPECVDSIFVSLAIRSSYFQRLVAERAGTGTLPIISKAKWEVLPIPLPPLAEQRRIVSKVEGLMSLCDKLEDARRARERVRERASRSVLVRLTSAPRSQESRKVKSTNKKPSSTAKSLTQETLASSWKRLSDHFEVLLDQPESVPHLRQSILQLAVQGKLVPQNPFDEPAIVDQLGNLLRENSLNGYSKKPSDVPEGVQVLRISAGTARSDFYVEETEHKWAVVKDKEREKFSLQTNDLLACRFNGNLRYVGKFSLYRNELGKEQIYPDKLIRFRVDLGKLLPLYAVYALNAKDSRLKIESFCATTAGNIGISATNLKTIEMLVPPLAEQKRIVSRVAVLLSQCDELSARLRSRQSSTDALLTALIHQVLESTK